MHRDGQCRRAVMWYVHHLPELTEEVLDVGLTASLPTRSSCSACRMRSLVHSRRRSLAQADTFSVYLHQCVHDNGHADGTFQIFEDLARHHRASRSTFSTDSLKWFNIDMTI